ncbi:XRE family transcriptional regulator [Streptomyces sp. NPDC101145]|uniref:XRE family transcriptional regulator n=1 Tax=Streptomyces sp. NPDC101145 TaxID=3366112 RepID=UPI0037F902CE
MAEHLEVDLGTVQGWESGRRPLGNMKAAALLSLRRRLGAMGAAPGVLGLLDPAMDADQIISAALDPAGWQAHPLASWVHTRDTAHMLAWALTGVAPSALARYVPAPRRGPSVAAPPLGTGDRLRVFDHLRETAEAAWRPSDALLRRQALYLASYDRSPGAVSWTAHALRSRRGDLVRRGWSPLWPQARSTATALARLGDPQPLLDFIEKRLVDDEAAETANLNYWAYWLGGVRLPQPDDRFMLDCEPTAWDPVTLLRGLTYGLHHAPGYVDLYAHTLWALLTSRPWLPLASPPLAGELTARTEALLDGGGLTERSRRELTTVHYVLRECT